MSELARLLGQSSLERTLNRDLSDVFSEIPPPLDIFVSDRKYLGAALGTKFQLSDIQWDLVRHIEQIYFPETIQLLAENEVQKERLVVGTYATYREKPYWAEPVRLTNKITAMWGKGAGKDNTVRVATLRVINLLLSLKSPQLYYDMPDADSIHTLNVATNARQAMLAFFDPIKRAVKKGWFEDKCNPTMNQVEFDKNVLAISGHSDAESQEGLNLILGIADEIDAFPSTLDGKRRGASAITNSAEHIMNMMDSSASTRFPDIYKLVAISYPRYLGSPIMSLISEGKKDNEEEGNKSNYYVSGPYATWEVNPRVTGPEKFLSQYKKDPIEAAAKYECKPARAVNPYFRNEAAVKSSFHAVEKDPVTVTYVQDRDTWRPEYDFADDFIPINGALYAMHGDLAINGDRAGIAMAHVVSQEEFEDVIYDEDGAETHVREMRPNVKVDFVISYEADISSDPPREIQIRWARQLSLELRKRGFNIQRFTFDGFQCLSGDTKIPLLDGTEKTMAELEGSEPFWLYAVNSEGRVVPAVCSKAWSTGFRDDMLEITLDNGEVVKATDDHRFMLRDGSYLPARDLQVGSSLMPLYRRYRKLSDSTQMYEQLYHPSADSSGQHWRYTHSMVSHYMYGKLPKGWVTHHKNVNSLDNRPENLLQLTNAQHRRLHSRLAGNRFTELWQDDSWRAEHIKRLSANSSNNQLGKAGELSRRYRHEVSFADIDAVTRRLADTVGLSSWKQVASELGCDQSVLYSRIQQQGFDSWKEYKWSVQPQSYSALATMRSRGRKKVNHKVVSTRRIPGEKVYDLQVDKYHNFAVSAGVFVHNSKDSMQILEEVHGIESDRVSTDRSPEPWRNLKDLMHDGRIWIPARPVLLNEILSLNQLPNGKVDHPLTGSKDEADALACAVFGAVDLGGEEDPDGGEAHYEEFEILVGTKIEKFAGFEVENMWFDEPSDF